MNTSPDFLGHDEPQGLTPIHPRIHSGATPDELMTMQIDQFLDALADVALSVAARSLGQGGEGNPE